MKKYVLGLFISLILGCGSIFAQEVLPDSATIEVKNPVIEGEATNLKITMMKNGSTMTSYTGTIIIFIKKEDGELLKPSNYTLSNPMYTFEPRNLGSFEFQKGLEFKEEGNYYIEVEDLNDPVDDNTLGKELVHVVKNGGGAGNVHIDVFDPAQNSILHEKIDILARAESLPNSNVSVYIDDQIFGKTTTDSYGSIHHAMQNIDQGTHYLKLEISDVEGNILGTSDKILFTYTPQDIQGFKDIKVEPETGLFIGDSIDVTVITDEAVEYVKLRLSDNSDDVFLTKEGNEKFSGKTFLISTGIINLSIDVTAFNDTLSKSYDNIKSITVYDLPEISNIKTDIDAENQIANILWDSSEFVSWYLVNFRSDSSELTGKRTQNNYFQFTNVPYDTPIYLNITPYLGEELTKHGAASQTIQFIIRKPIEETESDDSNTNGTTSIPTVDTNNNNDNITTSKCTIQNIATRTVKIGDNYYLVRDKVENVSKYIIYSSESPLGIDRTKVYETTDTSYEYPFDHTSEEDQFMYFRIVGICDDGEKLELSGATKVQVGPVQDFFLLVCMTLLIYFGIRLFRETEE